MAYCATNFKTKKELKEAVKAGKDVRCFQPGLGPPLYLYTGKICLEGPHYPEPHKWYCEAELVNGKVIKVK